MQQGQQQMQNMKNRKNTVQITKRYEIKKNCNNCKQNTKQAEETPKSVQKGASPDLRPNFDAYDDDDDDDDGDDDDG